MVSADTKLPSLAFLNSGGTHEGSSDTHPAMDDGGCHQHPDTLHQISQNVDERRPYAGVFLVAAALSLRLGGSVTVAVWSARLMEDQRHPARDESQTT